MEALGRLDYPKPPLSDDLVALRPWEARDVGCVESARLDAATAGRTTLPGPAGEGDGLDWISRQWRRQEDRDGISLAICDQASDTAHGAVVLLLTSEPGVADVGYWLAPGARGQGYATHAVRLIACWALTVAGFARVGALVDPDNTPSRHVLERARFVREGRLRSRLSVADRHLDALAYSLVARDLSGMPSPIQPPSR